MDNEMNVVVRSVHLRDPVQFRKRDTSQTEVSGRFLIMNDGNSNKWKITGMQTDGMLLYISSENFVDAAIPCSNILIMEMVADELAVSAAAPSLDGARPSEEPGA